MPKVVGKKKRSRTEVSKGRFGDVMIKNVIPKTRDKMIVNPKNKKIKKVFNF